MLPERIALVGLVALCSLLVEAQARGFFSSSAAGSAPPGSPVQFSAELGANGSADAPMSASLAGQLDAAALMQLASNPLAGAVKYALPNTYQGISADFGNGLGALSSGASSGLGSVQSSLQSISDNAINRYKQFQQNLARQFINNEEMMLRLYELALDPQRMCRTLADQGQSALQQAAGQAGQAQEMLGQFGQAVMQSQAANQAAQTSGSLFNKLGAMSLGR